MVLELSIDESADDITAAATAPRPMTATAGGVRYCRTSGRMNRESTTPPFSASVALYPVWDQSTEIWRYYGVLHMMQYLHPQKFTSGVAYSSNEDRKCSKQEAPHSSKK